MEDGGKLRYLEQLLGLLKNIYFCVFVPVCGGSTESMTHGWSQFSPIIWAQGVTLRSPGLVQVPLLLSHLVGPKLLALEEQSCNMAILLARPLTPLEPKLPRRFSLGTSRTRPNTGWP